MKNANTAAIVQLFSEFAILDAQHIWKSYIEMHNETQGWRDRRMQLEYCFIQSQEDKVSWSYF